MNDSDFKRGNNFRKIDVTLPIDPATLTTAQQKGVTKDGRVYTKAKVKRAHARIVNALREACGLTAERSKLNPWAVSISFIYKPKSLRKREYSAPKTTRPDLDNLAKSILDAITDVRIAWEDDGQIAQLCLRKTYVATPKEAACIRLSLVENKRDL